MSDGTEDDFSMNAEKREMQRMDELMRAQAKRDQEWSMLNNQVVGGEVFPANELTQLRAQVEQLKKELEHEKHSVGKLKQSCADLVQSYVQQIEQLKRTDAAGQ